MYQNKPGLYLLPQILQSMDVRLHLRFNNKDKKAGSCSSTLESARKASNKQQHSHLRYLMLLLKLLIFLEDGDLLCMSPLQHTGCLVRARYLLPCQPSHTAQNC